MQVGYAFVGDLRVALHTPLVPEAADRVLASVIDNITG